MGLVAHSAERLISGLDELPIRIDREVDLWGSLQLE